MSKTALDLTRQEWQKYRLAETIERRRNAENSYLEGRKKLAWQIAGQAATLLKAEFKASRVIVFGSLTHTAWFNEWSDIDLAAWDISPDRFYQAVAAVISLSSDFKIDLVDSDSIPSSLKAVIEQRGIEL